MLHPVGPEPAQTYWMRRVVVIAVAVVVLASRRPDRQRDEQRVRRPGQPLAAAAGRRDAATGSPTPKPSAGGPVQRRRDRRHGRPVAASATASGPRRRRPRRPRRSPARPRRRQPVACAPDTLRPTLTGKQRLKPKEPTPSRLSLINGSGQTCSASVSPDNFELRIYSGSDRIWSTKDCATLVKPVRRSWRPSRRWSGSWPGTASAPGPAASRGPRSPGPAPTTPPPS